MRNVSECRFVERDGAGQYCRLIPMLHDQDYPHKYWRVFCYGNTFHMNCEGRKRNLLINSEGKE